MIARFAWTSQLPGARRPRPDSDTTHHHPTDELVNRLRLARSVAPVSQLMNRVG